jgi:predicted transcriptional regulator YdeE
MNYRIVEKESFSVIGKEGSGPSDKGPQWIASLWLNANRHFMEVENLARKTPEGFYSFWGAMSDLDLKFAPWDNGGRYLAGVEVVDGAIPPAEWTKWTIPGYRYVVARCTNTTYGQVFKDVLSVYFPEKGYRLAGAVHECYSPKDAEGEFDLYFPISIL